MTNFSPLKLKTFTWRVVALQLTLQQNDEQEDCPSNMAHLPHCNHEFWKAVQETEWSVQFYRWTLVDTSACDLRGTQDLLMMLHVTEQQPVKKIYKKYRLHWLEFKSKLLESIWLQACAMQSNAKGLLLTSLGSAMLFQHLNLFCMDGLYWQLYVVS